MTGAAFTAPAAAVLAVDDSAVSPGVLGFVVVALLGVATYLLIRSMNRQIKRIDLPGERTSEDAPEEDVPPAGDDRAPR
ncbi:MAG TPA: hypothetical protein VEX89_03590 [Actinomycetes bacterium]|nr:hypothetical protein [Actinomycetes bacterium]